MLPTKAVFCRSINYYTIGDVTVFFLMSFFGRKSSTADSCTLATHACHRLKFDSILQKNGIDFVAVDELGSDSGPRNSEKMEVMFLATSNQWVIWIPEMGKGEGTVKSKCYPLQHWRPSVTSAT